MTPVFLAATASVLVYVVAAGVILPLVKDPGTHTRAMIDRLREQSAAGQGVVLPREGALQEAPMESPFVKAFLWLPGTRRALPLIQRAGLLARLDRFALGCAVLFLLLMLALAPLGIITVPLAALLSWLLAFMYLRRRIRRYRRQFLELFPDALDSIVRSVRAGYPLNSAIALVGDNTPAPVGPEFKRVADETAYGWTLLEALTRMADRVDEPDVRYFTIVLSVQQESGGSLSEVLTNLSSVLRRRKQMRMKIYALSSEGRATAWVLGSLPFFLFAVIWFIAPQHLQPLFNTDAGNFIICLVLGMIATGMLIVRQIVNIEV